MNKHLLKWIRPLAGLFIAAGVFTGCIDDSYDLDNMSNDAYLDYNTYMPLGRSSVKMSDLLKKLKVEGQEEGADGTITFVYDTTMRTVLDPFKLKISRGKYYKKFDLPAVEVPEDMPDNLDDIWNADEVPNLDDLIPDEYLEDPEKLRDILRENGIEVGDDFDPKNMDQDEYEDLKNQLQNLFLSGKLKKNYLSYRFKNNETYEYEVPIEIELELDSAEARIDSLLITKGEFVMRMKSSNLKDIHKHVSIGLEDRGGFVIGGVSNAFSWDASKAEGRLNLANKALRLPPNGDTLKLTLTLTVEEGFEIELNGKKGKVEVRTDPTTIEYKAIYGAYQTFTPQNESVNLALDVFHQGNIKFDLDVNDPRLMIEIYSNSGVPIEGKLFDFKAKNQYGKVVQGKFKDEGKENLDSITIDIKNATEDDPYVLAVQKTFDKDNGHLHELINCGPDSLFLGYSYRLAGDVASGNTYFLHDTTYIDTRIRAEIPFDIGSASFIEMADTLSDLNMKDNMKDYDNGDYKVDLAELFIEFENGLPLDAYVTAKFVEVDSIVSNGVKKAVRKSIDAINLDQEFHLAPAQVDENTRHVVTLVPTSKTFKVMDAQVSDLKRVDEILIYYKVKLPKGNGAKITGDCSISAKAYAHAKAGYNIKINNK